MKNAIIKMLNEIEDEALLRRIYEILSQNLLNRR